LSAKLNDRLDDYDCITAKILLQTRRNAASATWPNVNVGKVRDMDVHALRSE
jgi:hypothetical protein